MSDFVLEPLRHDDPHYDGLASAAEQKYGLPSGLLVAIKNAGERSDPGQVSPKQARGVMQFIPETAKAYGVDTNDQGSVIDGAGRMMRDLLKQYNGHVGAAIAHYNGGTEQGRLVAAGQEPQFPETRAYLQRVAGALGGAGARAQPVAARQPVTIEGEFTLEPVETPADRATAANQRFTRAAQGDRSAMPTDERLTVTGDFLDNAAAGAGKAVSDLGLGIKQGAQKIGRLVGAVDDSTVAATNAEAADRRQRDAALMRTGGGITGNIAGNIAMTAIPGGALSAAGRALPAASNVGRAMTTVGQAVNMPRTFGQAATVGAGLGALQPVTEDGGELERITNMATGGVGSVLGRALGRGVGRVLSPQSRPQVRALLDEGVTPTPGQMLGGAAQVAEEKLTSVPILGDAIRSGQRRAIEDLNRAAYNRALSPIGQQAGKDVGREGVAGVESALSGAYRQLLPQVTLQADQPLVSALQNVRTMAQQLPQQQADAFEKILRAQVIDKFAPGGRMSGETMKQVESELGRLSRGYASDAAFDNRQLGTALRQVQDELRQALSRSNPAHADELSKINEGWSIYSRVRDAASRMGSKEGVISPAQLAAAVRKGDTSVGKGAYARGDAWMQDLSDAAVNVLGSKYPDSGSIGRLLLGGGAALGTGAVNPAIPAALGGASLAYTPIGQKLIAAILAKRPELMQKAGGFVGNEVAGRIGSGVGGFAPGLLPPEFFAAVPAVAR